MAQLRQHEQEFTDRNVSVAIVTFDANFMAKAYQTQTNLHWPLLIDSDMTAYEAFRMHRGSWWSIYNPASILGFLKLIVFKRRRLHKPGSDYRQMGGDTLIDPNGIIRFHFASATPHDRPDAIQILKCVTSTHSDEFNATMPDR